MSERPTRTLWGIDGFLAGNEKRIHACMPVLRIEGREAIYVARRPDWSLETLEGLTALSETEAVEVTEQLELSEPCAVESGEIVAVVGPTYRRHLDSLRPAMEAGIDRIPWRAAQGGFQIAMLTPSRYEELRAHLYEGAKDVFDREIARRRRELALEARAALEVLRQTTHGPPEEAIVRTLVACRVEKHGDAYNRALTLGAVDLDCSPDDLERMAARWYQVQVETAPFSVEAQGRAAAADPGTASWGSGAPGATGGFASPTGRPEGAMSEEELTAKLGTEPPAWLVGMLGALERGRS
jgi:hypothetical protein